LESGTVIGPYTVLERLGAGGMGEVYSAWDGRLDRRVAIKVLAGGAAKERNRLQRFMSEAKVVSGLNHPNILTLHEIGEAAFGPYLVTELVEGVTLRERLGRGPLEPAEALDIAIQAADGLAKAHQSGIVHRDLKPENLMITEDGFVKILDFGLAKLLESEGGPTGFDRTPQLTSSGTIVGTVGYVSPEQLQGRPADNRSDVFALGIVLWEMLTGGNPFQRRTAAETLSAILYQDPPPLAASRPGTPAGIGRVLARALAKDPSRRFQNARDLAGAMRTARAELTSDMAAVRPAGGSARRVRGWGLGAGAVLLLAVVGTLILRSGKESAPGPVVVLPPGRLAVAVLPIQNRIEDEAVRTSPIGRVLTDGFVRILSGMPGVYVVSPVRLSEVAGAMGRSLEEAAGDPAFAQKAAEAAQATAVLSGTLDRVGDTFILNATLTDLSSRTLLGSFGARAHGEDRILHDLTAQIAQDIRDNLDVPASMPGIEEVATGSLEAYTSFIRGRDRMESGQWEEAVPDLKRAVGLDPGMGLGWSLLACAYSFAGNDDSSRAAQKVASTLTDRVNEKERLWIDLNGIWVQTGNGDEYRKAAREFIQRFPDDREGYFYAGLGAEWLRNDCGEALGYYEKAYLLTPNYYAITKGLVDCNLKLGRRADAVRVLERYLTLPLIGNHGRAQAEGRLAELRDGA
jgi:tetratricopeptide (TPR) repeat protein